MKGLTQYLTEHQKTFSQSQKNKILERIFEIKIDEKNSIKKEYKPLKREKK